MIEACKSRKDGKTNKKKLLSIGAVEKLLRKMSEPDTKENIALFAKLCAALSQLTGLPDGATRAAKANAIFIVTVPATIITSACLGVALGIIPNLSKSCRGPAAAIISIAQQAKPN